MADTGRRLSADDREALLLTARSRQSSQGVAVRARLVIDCADVGVAEAARRSSVSRATAAKWWRRYLGAGVDVAGVSQATVSRIRRRYFRRVEPTAAFLGDLSTSILAYVDVYPSGCALGFQASSGASRGGTSTARTDIIETIVCAALLRSPVRGQGEAVTDASDAVAVLCRAAERLPLTPAVTLIIDAELDPPARQWLSCHPEIKAHAVTGDDWLGMLHCVADAVDPRQLVAETEPPVGNLTQVVRGICTAISEGELQAGDSISARRIARRSGVSPGHFGDALAQLAEESLIDDTGAAMCFRSPSRSGATIQMGPSVPGAAKPTPARGSCSPISARYGDRTMPVRVAFVPRDRVDNGAKDVLTQTAIAVDTAPARSQTTEHVRRRRRPARRTVPDSRWTDAGRARLARDATVG